MDANPASSHQALTWRRLVVAAAAGLLVLSLGQAIVRGDREALALVVVIVIGLVLLGRGTGTLGAVFLSLVFGDFLVWTMWAAMNNLRHGEEPEDVTLPALLAILSLTGWSPAGRHPRGELHRPTRDLPVLLPGTRPRRSRHARHPDHPLSRALFAARLRGQSDHRQAGWDPRVCGDCS